jgi:regulator of sigma E protease
VTGSGQPKRWIFAPRDRRGTHWRVAALPLGGYVKFFGEGNSTSLPDEPLLEATSPQERAVSFSSETDKRMPVIPLPGSPGGGESVKPK